MLRELPLWIRQDKAITRIPADLSYLGLGEREAIQIASTEPHIDLILLDDRQARAEARRRGLKITGTLGVLLDAADRGFIDPHRAYQRLISETNFRTSPMLEAQFLSRPI